MKKTTKIRTTAFSPTSSRPESSASSRIFTAIRQGNGLQQDELCWSGKQKSRSMFCTNLEDFCVETQCKFFYFMVTWPTHSTPWRLSRQREAPEGSVRPPQRQVLAAGQQRLDSSPRCSCSDKPGRVGAHAQRFASSVRPPRRLGCRLTVSRCAASGPDSVDCRTPRGQTPLFLAVEEGLMENASFLLQHGAQANGQDQELESPLLTGGGGG